MSNIENNKSGKISKIKQMQENVSDLMLKIICKNMIISAQQLEIKILKEKLNEYIDKINQ